MKDEDNWVYKKISNREYLEFFANHNPEALDDGDIDIIEQLDEKEFKHTSLHKCFYKDGHTMRLTHRHINEKDMIGDGPIAQANREYCRYPVNAIYSVRYSIIKFEDEWYIVVDSVGNNQFLCDDVDGITQLFKDILGPFKFLHER